MPNKKILVTGGAGFVGTNLIKLLINKTKYNIISLDNYSSGSKKNHIKSKRVKYIKGKTANIENLIKKPGEINSIFHFGEFARIYQSFFLFIVFFKDTNNCRHYTFANLIGAINIIKINNFIFKTEPFF